MIIVIFLVCVSVIVLGAWLYNYTDEFPGGVTMACGIIGSIISFIALIVLLVIVSGLKTVDLKIDMYQTENTQIENQITECIKEYQKYETEIFTEISPDSAITLVSLYPELKADELVKKQIEIYVANNQKIKELKEEKIMGNVYRWWTYFGSKKIEGRCGGMIVCDLCLNEIKPEDKMPKIRIHTQYVCKAWQEEEIDMCEECLKELKEKINQTEAEFYQKKKHLLE